MSKTIKSQDTCVIVLDVGTGGDSVVIGALADSVHEVFEFEAGKIEPPPRVGTMQQKDFIQGIGKRNDQFIILLNINKVFSTDEVLMLGETTVEERQTQADEELTEAC